MLSVCIITKNEKEALEHCLLQLTGYGFELVVVDTGSTDGTMQMARRYTDAVYEFAWCDDFAKAKNYAVSKARQDMVLVIDSDEYLKSIDLEALAGLIRRFPKAVGRIERLSQMGQGGESREFINRLFDRRYYHYKGKIHEQLTAKGNGPYQTYLAPVVIDHSGYLLSEEGCIQKAMRNIRLLQEALQDPEIDHKEEDPYILYQLGKSYTMMGEQEKACGYYSKALSFDLNPQLEYVIDLVDSYGYALLNSGQASQALAFTSIYQEFGKRADFQFLMGLIYMNNSQFENAISEFQKAAGQETCKVSGVNSYLAHYNTGVIYECTGNRQKALEFYQKCGEYEPAKKRIIDLGSFG